CSSDLCLELLDAVVAETERLRDDFRLVLSARDIDAAAQAGQIGVLLSIEDGAALEGSLSALRAFYRLGVRAMGLTWNGRNELGEGVGAAKGAGGGLTAFGRDVVREMRSEEHTSELQSREKLVCRLLPEKK